MKVAPNTKLLNDADEAALERWLLQQGVADYLGVSIRQVQVLTRQGRLPVSYALGPRSPRYDRHAIDAAMTEAAENGAAMNETQRGFGAGLVPMRG